MRSFKLFVFACMCVEQIVECSLAEYNYSLYSALPALFTLEDYDSCMKAHEQHANNSYCIVHAEIIPNDTSTLWQSIATHSSDYMRHYRHDLLMKGVCVERCQRLLKASDAAKLKELYQGKTVDQKLAEHFREIFGNEAENLEELLGTCLNVDFQKQHELSLRTHIVYCEHNNKVIKYDVIDYTFVYIVAAILILSALSSLYDHRLQLEQYKPTDDDSTFYRNDCGTPAQRMLTAFSVRRNYYRLFRAPANEMADELRVFDGFRVSIMPLIIILHILLATGSPFVNANFVEEYYYLPLSYIFINGTPTVENFFLLTGFLLLLTVKMEKQITEKSSLRQCLGYFFKSLLRRYLRLAPPLLFFMLFESTFAIRLLDGPIWRLGTTQVERVNCRNYWWKNALFINNIDINKSCAPHTWYLAADMQLYVLYMTVLIVCEKFPNFHKRIYICILTLALIIPAVVTYTQNLKHDYFLRPETFRFFHFRDSPEFHKAHIPFYMNLNGYLFGIVCAHLYLKLRNNTAEVINQLRGKFIYEFSWWMVFPILVFITTTGSTFAREHKTEPSILRALYAALHPVLWLTITSSMIMSSIYKVGGIGRHFLRLPFLRVLSKISYQAYIWHGYMIVLQVAYLRTPMTLSYMAVFNVLIGAWILTNLTAFVGTIFFELPIAQVFRLMFEKMNRRTVILEKKTE